MKGCSWNSRKRRLLRRQHLSYLTGWQRRELLLRTPDWWKIEQDRAQAWNRAMQGRHKRPASEWKPVAGEMGT